MIQTKIQTLPHVSDEHRERLMRHLDRLPRTGDLIGSASLAELKPEVEATNAFLTGLLVPHMEATELTLYPALEQLLQNRHSMTPMRREHDEIRRLVKEFEGLSAGVAAGHLTTGGALALRRVIFGLYARLKIHLAEEKLYLGVLEKGVSADAAEVLASAMEHAGTAEF